MNVIIVSAWVRQVGGALSSRQALVPRGGCDKPTITPVSENGQRVGDNQWHILPLCAGVEAEPHQVALPYSFLAEPLGFAGPSVALLTLVAFILMRL